MNYYDFSNVKLTLHSWDKPHLVMLFIVFTYLWIQFAIFVFASVLMRATDLQFVCFLIIASVLMSGQCWLKEGVEKYYFLFNFPEQFMQKWHYFFLKRLLEFTSDAIRSLVLFMGRFLSTNTISLVHIILLKLFISSRLSLGNLYLSKNLPSSSCLLILQA